MSIYEKRLKFLDDTIEYFTNNPRGMSERVINTDTNETAITCSYTGGCAIGRHVDKELCETFDSLGPSSGVCNNLIFYELPEWMQELGEDFLSRVQNLHDNEVYWNDGLSNKGTLIVDSIKKDFCKE